MYIWGLEIKSVNNYFFLENYGPSEGAVSHNVLYHQPLPITRHQGRFYANNYFEELPIVSTAFKTKEIGLPLNAAYPCWLVSLIHRKAIELNGRPTVYIVH